ncbi:unnamed protein product, partial [Didymodactylos carnosus]
KMNLKANGDPCVREEAETLPRQFQIASSCCLNIDAQWYLYRIQINNSQEGMMEWV